MCSKSLMTLAYIFFNSVFDSHFIGTFCNTLQSLLRKRLLSGGELMVILFCLRGRKIARNVSSQGIHTPSSYSAALHCDREKGVVTVMLRQNIVEFLEVLNLICSSSLWSPNPSLQKYMHSYRKFIVSRAFFYIYYFI